MCGIVGLFAKTPSTEEQLGRHLAEMLVQLTDRGPDSAGVALYRRPGDVDPTNVERVDQSGTPDWDALAREAAAVLGSGELLADRGDQALIVVEAPAPAARAWVAAARPGLSVLSAGTTIETAKRTGAPTALIDSVGLRDLDATHALGHTRMATESRVTTAGSHPFSTGPDLCLVHNGSLSNHNRLRRDLLRRGIGFQTENDSEVAAGYLTWRLAEGDTLEEALDGASAALDGFFTFAVGTRDGFAVLRDPIGCKPALLAETDAWVAMASEHRAIAVLPGAQDAHVWEPEPGQVYSWSRTAVPA